MARAEVPPLHNPLERLGHTVRAIPLWAGRHWESLSLAAAAVAGGGYILITHDRGPQNPPVTPNTTGDTFNRPDSGIDVIIPIQQEIDPNAVRIIFDQSSRATIAAENGHILRILPPPVSQEDALNRDQGFKIEVFWETLAGTPKPSRPFSYKITTENGERVDGYVRYAAQASIKQEETSPQPNTSPSIDPKSLRVIFVDDIGSILAIGPDGRLVRAIQLPSSYQIDYPVDVSIWRNTTGGKIVGDPVGARLTTDDGTDITPHIEKVTQLNIAA